MTEQATTSSRVPETASTESQKSGGSQRLPRVERRGHDSRIGRYKTPIAAVALLAVGIGAGIGINKWHNRGDKLAEAQRNEVSFFDKGMQRNTPFQLRSARILLHAGVVVRQTPDMLDTRTAFKIPFLTGNVQTTIGKSEVGLLREAVVYTDSNDVIWYGFQDGNGTVAPAQRARVSPRQVAERTNWINYSALDNAVDKGGQHYVEILPDAADSAGTAQISDSGQFISSNGQPAAWEETQALDAYQTRNRFDAPFTK